MQRDLISAAYREDIDLYPSLNQRRTKRFFKRHTAAKGLSVQVYGAPPVPGDKVRLHLQLQGATRHHTQHLRPHPLVELM